jgi:hypothetical protein
MLKTREMEDQGVQRSPDRLKAMNLFPPLLDLHYAQWIMIAGGVLVVIGFFGFALNQNLNPPPEDLPAGDDPSKATENGLKAKGK